MSDRIETLTKEYNKNVPVERSRSVGLFTIPEYPELEEPGMWATVLEVLLTTLRYLAPATILTLFWGHQRFFFNLLKYIDSAFRTLIFSHEEQKQEVIEWLSEVGPVRVEDLDTVWRQGWIVCGVLDAALPGACAGHAPTRLSLKHAQAIADHYLGVEPMFSRQELEANDVLSKHEEWKLIKFLERIRIAIAKLTPPSSTPKQITERPSSNTTQFTLDYIARGSGLSAAQINNKMYFKIYPTAQQSLDPGEITIVIRGPRNIYGMSTLPPVLGKAQMIRQTLLGLQAKQNNYTDNILPVTQGATYLRNYGKNDMNKTYYIPKTQYDIEIDIERNSDHAKIGYTIPTEGKYEISITSRGENIVGSPFIVTASKNILGTLEKDSFCLEDGEEIDIVDVKTDRKVVLRIVDFVTEKMLLKENGSLEKITEDEAKNLMEFDSLDYPTNTNNESNTISNNEKKFNESKGKSTKFYNVASQILKMNKVCKAINNFERSKSITTDIGKKCSQKDVPDIVNSTLIENQTIPLNDHRERIIIPENISVSLLMDKSKDDISKHDIEHLNSQDLENYKILRDPFDDDNMSTDTIQSTNNPFLNDIYDTTYTEKEFRSFIASEYETNNSQHEESHTFSNPFYNIKQNSKDTEIIPPTAEDQGCFDEFSSDNRDHFDEFSSEDKDHFDENSSLTSNISIAPGQERVEIIEKGSTNPFIILNPPESDEERLPVTDFIIGAPVSLPPIVTSVKESIMSLNKNTDKNYRDSFHFRKENDNASFLSSQESLEQREDIPSISPFHSLGSDTYNFLSQSNLQRSRDISPRELWDSAYVSIDDNASTPDNNNNSNDRSVSETLVKNNMAKEFNTSLCIEPRETWDGSSEVGDNSIHDDIRNFRWEFKRPVFTPIIEETEKSLTSGLKDNIHETETDTVSQAFAELNEIYDEIFPKPEESISSENEESTLHNAEVEYMIEDNKIRVNSASENLSDVKRLAGEIEGSISEVQANETESVSASRDLRDVNESAQNKEGTQFGDTLYSNIVLEKKRYWDEKIRLIEAKKLEESKLQQRRKRISAKHFKYNDSLSKRKGKQIVKNFLKSGDHNQINSKTVANTDETTHVNTVQVQLSEDLRSDIKLVEKWKNYWDTKVEKDSMDNSSALLHDSLTYSRENITCFETDEYEANVESRTTDMNISELNINNNASPVKHELPEEVFKAFETCPKRFFGTSRRHILNKIDSFLGKPTVENVPKPEHIISLNHESGLVSSRISLFHNISQSEELPLPRTKQTQNHNKLLSIKSNSEMNTRNKSEKDSMYLNPEDSNEIKEHAGSMRNTSDGTMPGIKSTLTTQTIQVEAKEIESPLTSEQTKSEEEEFNLNKDITISDSPNTDIVEESTQVKNIFSPKDSSSKNVIIENDQSQRKVKCRKLKTFSKSEMDIFNKISSTDINEDFDKHKSVEELPKINVKNFITLYEDVSKSTQSQLTKPVANRKSLYNSSSSPGTPLKSHHIHSASKHFIRNNVKPMEENSTKQTIQNTNCNSEGDTRCSSVQSEIESNLKNDRKYLSLSDIELEIIEQKDEKKELCTSQKAEETSHIDYKSRFKSAKEYFQSLEELRDVKKDRKLSECKIKLNGQSTESLDDEEKPKECIKTRKIKSKSLSMPSSEISRIWNELQGKTKQEETETKKLVKISEKFNVEDLFEDVMEGRLSRQGSLRGIPHKKAVLETFKSMENISDNKLNSYDMVVSQHDFSQQNLSKNAQTYLSEYPYLPTTDPSKFQSRFDASASGLISYNELLKSKRRRNSVPDIRLNPSFTENLNV